MILIVENSMKHTTASADQEGEKDRIGCLKERAEKGRKDPG